jgi:GNAT superfamily N-acetyltransferase
MYHHGKAFIREVEFMAVEILQVETDEHIKQARGLFTDYMAFTTTIAPDDLEKIPTFQGYADEFAALPGIYAPPKGRLFLALSDERPAGCIALKPISATVGELKRLYVRPTFRGQKIGAQLVESLIDAAREIGYSKIILDSHKSMTTAHAIYQQRGFEVIETPADFPEALRPHVVFMELNL